MLSVSQRVLYNRFHVDKMSSAHVYVRLHKGQTIDDISEGLLEDCAQLVKANSIQGQFLSFLQFYANLTIYVMKALCSPPRICCFLKGAVAQIRKPIKWRDLIYLEFLLLTFNHVDTYLIFLQAEVFQSPGSNGVHCTFFSEEEALIVNVFV